MFEIEKTLKKVQAQYKGKNKYIPPHENKNPKDREAKRIEEILSNILIKVNNKYEALEDIKEDIEGMKWVISSHF